MKFSALILQRKSSNILKQPTNYPPMKSDADELKETSKKWSNNYFHEPNCWRHKKNSESTYKL